MKKKISIMLLTVAITLLIVSCSNKAEETIRNYEDLCSTFKETENVYTSLSMYPPLLVSNKAEFSADTSKALISLLYNAIAPETLNITAVTRGEGKITRTSGESRTEYVMDGVKVDFKYTLDDGSEKDSTLSLSGKIVVDKAKGEIETESLTLFGNTYRDMYLKGNLSKGIYEKAYIGGEEVDIRLINNEIGAFIL